MDPIGCSARDARRAGRRRPAKRFDADLNDYERRVRAGPCFICELVDGSPAYRHRIVYQDAECVAFMDKYPTLAGKVLVAPKRHIEHVVGDLPLDDFLRLMTTVYRVASAVASAVPTERIYLLSLGSQQGNRHIHWHVAPLPPGLPYDQQQFHALMMEHGVLALSPEDQEAVARRIEALMPEHE